MSQSRKIIQIDEELCNGCGQCITTCAEAALELVDGKAKLVGEILCDGLGACLSGCPTGALTIVDRPAEAFDEHAVEERLAQMKQPEAPPLACGCPGHTAMALQPLAPAPAGDSGPALSQLSHWPIKLQLLNPAAPYLRGANLLLLADCAAASLPNLHSLLLPGKAIALACPKLDNAQAHVDKLAQVLAGSQPASLTAVIMEVPCCKGLEQIARLAVQKAELSLEVGAIVVSRDGRILERRGVAWDQAA